MIWADIIERARFYVDDDHKEDNGWITPDKWLDLGNAEFRQQYRRWVRTGLVRPAHTITDFTSSTTLSNVLCVVGVAENLGSGLGVRLLNPGDEPWDSLTGVAFEWYATGNADTLAIGLHPADSSHNYTARHITRPALVTDPNAAYDGPDGSDERIALGMARRSLVKESSRSALLDQLINDADAELNMTAWGRKNGEAPRVRRVSQSRMRQLWPIDPGRWVFFG